ncbi:MAG TPA: hypothetical protein VH092_30945 [Urbifossiella sp.]|nr:hypothetical protein [Urbifossiella sp.]
MGNLGSGDGAFGPGQTISGRGANSIVHFDEWENGVRERGRGKGGVRTSALYGGDCPLLGVAAYGHEHSSDLFVPGVESRVLGIDGMGDPAWPNPEVTTVVSNWYPPVRSTESSPVAGARVNAPFCTPPVWWMSPSTDPPRWADPVSVPDPTGVKVSYGVIHPN